MKKILIIEDDIVVGQMVSDALREAGFSVWHTIDARQGQQVAFREPYPDLLILDLMLPAGNGVQMLRDLRESFYTQNIPIVVMTSFRDDEVKAEMEGLQIQGFFYKPFDEETMVTAINRILA